MEPEASSAVDPRPLSQAGSRFATSGANLVLIGYRGTGKSAVGKRLARALSRHLISTDAEVVKRAQCSIPDIVKQFGWEYFRDLESAVCRDVAAKEELIIDTDG